MNKVCPRCKINKSVKEFSSDSSKKDGLDSVCKQCRKKYREDNKKEISERTKKRYNYNKRKEYYENNKSKILLRNKEKYSKNKRVICDKQKKYNEKHREEKAIYNEKYRIKNEISLKKSKKEYYEKNREKKLLIVKQYAKNNREKINHYRRKKFESDIQFKLRCNLTSRIWYSLQGKDKSQTTVNLLGCSIKDFIIHIESQFPKNMTWDDYKKQEWQIDHIIPCIIYDLEFEENQKKCFNYRNLRPISKQENLTKHSKLDMDLINKYNIEDLLPDKIRKVS